METKEFILEDVNFNDLIEKTKTIFNPHFEKEVLANILTYIEIISNANFRCYQANMTVIAERKNDCVNLRTVSDCELSARTVGEMRVNTKAKLNKYISEIKETKGLNIDDKKPNTVWLTDDVVYSIGEMIDRLTIEFIKRADFISRPIETVASQEDCDKLNNKINQSFEWTKRVEKHLKKKLVEIDNKGFYECVEEMRTYDIEE